MELRGRISDALKSAMKEKAADRLSTLRLINAAIKDRDIAKRSEGGDGADEGVGDAEILQVGSQCLAPLWLGRCATLLAVALFIAMAGALGWFVLRHWVSLAEGAHQEVLGFPNRFSPSKEQHS